MEASAPILSQYLWDTMVVAKHSPTGSGGSTALKAQPLGWGSYASYTGSCGPALLQVPDWDLTSWIRTTVPDCAFGRLPHPPDSMLHPLGWTSYYLLQVKLLPQCPALLSEWVEFQSLPHPVCPVLLQLIEPCSA